MEDPGWRFVKRDGFLIMLGSCPDARKVASLGDHSYFAYLVVDDVDQFYEDLQKHAVDFLSEPENKPWQMREFGLRTPDGHRIMIGQDIP